jgi:hypothetical protein
MLAIRITGNQLRAGRAFAGLSMDEALRYPITGIAGCCARAASGHTAAAPPSSDMNSRRFTAQCLSCFSIERIAHLSYGRRLLRCGILMMPVSVAGQIPSLQ